MPLEIRNIKAHHAHENYQFRRIAKGLKNLFERNGWDGILIGNPESEVYSRFRADALLLYNFGLIVLDLKNFKGAIDLPSKSQDFKDKTWYLDTEEDKQRIVIKGGASFANPFKQLFSYRGVMKEVINTNAILRSEMNPNRIAAINLFSGPINLNNDVPGSLPYYKIVEENNLADFLSDYSSPNKFSENASKTLKAIFPAPEYVEHISFADLHSNTSSNIVEIEENVQGEIVSFLKKDESGILVLESMDVAKRDDWAKFILSEGVKLGIPQVEPWTHSTRIQRKIKTRSGVNPDSLYNTIYGGKSRLEDGKHVDLEQENVEDDDMKDIIPIKPNEFLDEKSAVILLDAHLVSRSLHQSELLKFGTGRLLEDLINFLSLGSSKRKLICIGDPYSLSYGKASESAIAIETLKELFDGKIHYFRDELFSKSDNGLINFKTDLAKSINSDLFNNLRYSWNEKDLKEVNQEGVKGLLKKWFSTPLNSEPDKSVLFYSKADAKKANLWIKKECLKNTGSLNVGDLLLLNNNVKLPDETGFGTPSRLYNGMYLKLLDVLDEKIETIQTRNSKSPIRLKYKKVKVQCLSLESKEVAEVWMNENYFEGGGDYSKEEQIALKILISTKIAERKKEFPFEESIEYKDYKNDFEYLKLSKELYQLQLDLEQGQPVKTKIKETEVGIRRVEKKYKQKYNHLMMLYVSSNDPILNAVDATYGWCITVHKSIGSEFKKIIIKAQQSESAGVNNENYFRWLYSGFSVCKGEVNVAIPIEFTPFRDCQFEDTVDEGWTEKTKTKKSLEFPDFNISKKIEKKLVSEVNENTKAAIALFSESIEKEGILLERTKKQNEYLTKAFYSTPNGFGEITMAFHNNGNGAVTTIRDERNGASYKRFIEKSKKYIEDFVGNDDSEKSVFPDDFRGDIYKDLIEESKNNGGKLSLLESKPYQDIFLYENKKEKVRFRMYYKGTGMFSSIAVLMKTSSEISIELYELLLNDD